MSRWTFLPTIALVMGLAAPGFGQFGGMGGVGGGMGGMMGAGARTTHDFGSAGAYSDKAEAVTVKLVATDGKSTTGSLRLTSVAVDCPFGVYEIKPEKVQEIRFGTPQTMGTPIIITSTGTQRGGQVVTTTGEVIDGTVLFPGWWRIETDLGALKPSPEILRSITFLRKTEESPPPVSPTGGPPAPVVPRPSPAPGPQGSPPPPMPG